MEWTIDEDGYRLWTYRDPHWNRLWLLKWHSTDTYPHVETEGPLNESVELGFDHTRDEMDIEFDAPFTGPVILSMPFIVMAAFVDAMREAKTTEQSRNP